MAAAIKNAFRWAIWLTHPNILEARRMGDDNASADSELILAIDQLFTITQLFAGKRGEWWLHASAIAPPVKQALEIASTVWVKTGRRDKCLPTTDIWLSLTVVQLAIMLKVTGCAIATAALP